MRIPKASKVKVTVTKLSFLPPDSRPQSFTPTPAKGFELRTARSIVIFRLAPCVSAGSSSSALELKNSGTERPNTGCANFSAPRPWICPGVVMPGHHHRHRVSHGRPVDVDRTDTDASSSSEWAFEVEAKWNTSDYPSFPDSPFIIHTMPHSSTSGRFQVG